MVATVYVLCAITSSLCFVLLVRAYVAGRQRLLFWSSLCFLGLAINNVILVYDLLVVPHIDLSLIRNIPTVLGLGSMIYGFIEDRQQPGE